MGKGKLAKFSKLAIMPNVFQNFSWDNPQLFNGKGMPVAMKGQWHKHFNNQHPIVLELACGYGEYTMAIAQQHPELNIIGVDMKGNRLYTGARYTLDKQLHNAAFVRTHINLLPHFFAPNEISEIWITFADPHLKKSKHKKRLTSLYYLGIYQQLMPNGGIVHLKTDSDILYHYTLETITTLGCTIHTNYYDLYGNDFDNPLLGVKTRYERLNLSGAETIKYLKFSLAPVNNP